MGAVFGSRRRVAWMLAGALALGGCGGEAAGDAEVGRQLFDDVRPPCGACHSLDDAGANGVAASDLDEARPTADEVVAAIGSAPGMPDYSGQLSRSQIEELAAYVSSAAGR